MVLRADVVGNVGGINVVWKRQDGRPIPTRHVQVNGKKQQQKSVTFGSSSEGQCALHPRGDLGGRWILHL